MGHGVVLCTGGLGYPQSSSYGKCRFLDTAPKLKDAQMGPQGKEVLSFVGFQVEGLEVLSRAQLSRQRKLEGLPIGSHEHRGPQ